ncbi:MAG: class I SAM-dependent methyltransferase [Planctomycetota bacterium]
MAGTTSQPADDYLTPYRQAAVAHGGGFGSTLWHSRDGQQLRFGVIAEMLEGLGDSPLGTDDRGHDDESGGPVEPFGLGGRTVLDAGCGPGDFAAWMTERRIGYARFVGVDGVDEVIEHARSRGLPRATFVAGDFVSEPALLATGEPSIVTLSGALNTMADDVAMRLLESMWASASEAIAFNFLSGRCDPGRARASYPARRLPTDRLLDWALRQTPLVRFRQDYFPGGHDATIAMRKPPA